MSASAIEGLIEQHYSKEERISLLELESTITDLVLYTGHPLLDGARPLSPNMQYFGTTHCKLPKALPKDIQEVFDNSADNGVILVSFGSYMLGKNMKESVLQALLKVFGQLKETVVWKWENDTMAGQPANVKLRKWVPQQDILGHPKTKLFITHAGQSSIQESLCHKKPVVRDQLQKTDFCSCVATLQNST